MGRVGGRVDINQKAVIQCFEQLGVSVLNCSRVGCGFPDLIVGFAGLNHLVEVKNPTNTYGRRGLNKNQEEWIANWPNPVFIVRTVDEVIALHGAWMKGLSVTSVAEALDAEAGSESTHPPQDGKRKVK